MNLPPLYRVQQQFDSDSIRGLPEAVRQQFEGLDASQKVQAGQSVAVAVGSRGIHHLETIVASVIGQLKVIGLKPFIIPAMGSHGGATAQGQATLLHDLGIRESAMGAPIISNMDVVSLGCLDSGAEVFFSKDALESDHLVVINRVKPHTSFRGEVESGLCKMLAIGCGRKPGASNMHRFGLGTSIVPAAKRILERAPILCGLAIVENASGGIESIELAHPHEFVTTDSGLLKTARALLPRIPIDDLDVLLIDEMGKDISGAGLDPNVTGFWRLNGGPREPDYRTLVVLDITEPSHGNATGIGSVDLTTRRVIDAIDLEATYTNCLTANVPCAARLPVALENDRVALETVLNQVPIPEQIRMVRIVNTLDLGTFWATKTLLPELREHDGILVDETPLNLEFNESARLQPFVI